jgi:peptidoglycan/xylan/chitin deacetylase (PgdA/CDA1 family)
MRRLLLALLTVLPATAALADPQNCEGKLGVSRTAVIDPANGAIFGDQYPPTKLLEKGEVVLTFDDGPHPKFTRQILADLAAECTKATFFNVGEMVADYPDISREVEAAGHTIGTHTWTHPNLASLSPERAHRQIESTFSILERTLSHGVAPFFRFPYLSDPKEVREYLADRGIAVFGIDVDSSDWRTHSPEGIVANIKKGLEKTGGGIILMHDVHEQSMKALPAVLELLKKGNYKVVHLVPKSHVEVYAYGPPGKAEPEHHSVRRKAHHRRRH